MSSSFSPTKVDEDSSSDTSDVENRTNRLATPHFDDDDVPYVQPQEKQYFPYRYEITQSRGGTCRIYTRSVCGSVRKVFSLPVKSWSYLSIGDESVSPSTTRGGGRGEGDAESELSCNRMVSILKDELSTDRVYYDSLFNVFIVEPSEAVTNRVREVAKRIVKVDLKTYSVLARFGQRFFDRLQENGVWAVSRQTTNSLTTSTPILPEPFDLRSSVIPIRTMIVSAVDSNTIAFLLHGGNGFGSSTTVHIWTTYTSFGTSHYVSGASAALMSHHPGCHMDFWRSRGTPTPPTVMDIEVRTFPNHTALTDELVNMLTQKIDIVVHYGEDDAVDLTGSGTPTGTPGPFAHAVRRIRNTAGASTSPTTPPDLLCEIFNLHDYVASLYTDMPNHSISAVLEDVNIFSTDDERTSLAADAYVPEDLLTLASASSLSIPLRPPEYLVKLFQMDHQHLSNSTRGGSTRVSSSECAAYIPDLRTTVHSAENVIFFLERITARAYLIARLYHSLSPSIFNLMQMSGCNLSTLTQPEHASRGVMSFLDPMVAWSQIVDVLPIDSIEAGIHPLSYVTPFSSLLIESMRESSHPLTRTVGHHIEPLRPYGWIVREIASLRDLRPNPIRDHIGAYGIFRGMVYSTVPLSNHLHVRQWSTIIAADLCSWIGISVKAPPTRTTATTAAALQAPPPASATPPTTTVNDHFRLQEAVHNSDSRILFGYFGIEEICRHPFDAVRIAVEMFITLRICAQTAASVRTIAQTITYTTENMMIRRRVTAANVETYAPLLPASEIAAIQSGERITMLSLWYKSSTRYTTNPLLANVSVYQYRVENILNRTFQMMTHHPGELAMVTPHPEEIPAASSSSAPPAAPIQQLPPIPPPGPPAGSTASVTATDDVRPTTTTVRETPIRATRDYVFRKNR